jgi:hypothetical protein
MGGLNPSHYVRMIYCPLTVCGIVWTAKIENGKMVDGRNKKKEEMRSNDSKQSPVS